ncbi:MAG: SCO family protein, partial [Balneolaceae bacterium]
MKQIGLAILICGLFLYPKSGIAQLNKQKPRNLNEVGITEHLGDIIPLDLKFANADGDSIILGDLFKDGKPVLLNPVYYECPQLCSMVKEGIFKGIKGLNWSPGKDYNIVTFSIDPNEGTKLAKRDKEKYLKKLDRRGVEGGWHFLTGKEKSINPLVDAIGYNFRKLDNGQYAHGTAIMFLSPKGKITRYLYGIDFKSFDIKNALYDAADGN